MNKSIKKYTTKSGKTCYKIKVYVSKDPKTGKSIWIRKQGFKSRKEAEKAFFEYKAKALNGECTPKTAEKRTFKELYKSWLKVYKHEVKESTFATTIRYFDDHILNILGNKYVDKITPQDCQNAVETWYKEAPRTFDRFKRYSSNVFQYGVDMELISRNPMNKVHMPKKPASKLNPKYYTRDELNTFLECAKKVIYKAFVYFRLLAYLGLRRGEGLALRWDDVNFEDGTIRVSRTLTTGLNKKTGKNNREYESDTPKTKGSIKTFKVDAETMNYLKDWRLKQQKEMLKLGFNFLDAHNLIFPNANNGLTAQSKPRQWKEKICKLCGLNPIRVHDFRHTYATLLVQSGVGTIKDVQQRLRHSDVKTTLNIYTHASRQSDDVEASKFAEWMKK